MQQSFVDVEDPWISRGSTTAAGLGYPTKAIYIKRRTIVKDLVTDRARRDNFGEQHHARLAGE